MRRNSPSVTLLQAHVFLELDDLGDRVVLDGAQRLGRDRAGGTLLARLEQALRAQEAADVVGAEGGLGAGRHGVSRGGGEGREKGGRRAPHDRQAIPAVNECPDGRQRAVARESGSPNSKDRSHGPPPRTSHHPDGARRRRRVDGDRAGPEHRAVQDRLHPAHDRPVGVDRQADRGGRQALAGAERNDRGRAQGRGHPQGRRRRRRHDAPDRAGDGRQRQGRRPRRLRPDAARPRDRADRDAEQDADGRDRRRRRRSSPRSRRTSCAPASRCRRRRCRSPTGRPRTASRRSSPSSPTTARASTPRSSSRASSSSTAARSSARSARRCEAPTSRRSCRRSPT